MSVEGIREQIKHLTKELDKNIAKLPNYKGMCPCHHDSEANQEEYDKCEVYIDDYVTIEEMRSGYDDPIMIKRCINCGGELEFEMC